MFIDSQHINSSLPFFDRIVIFVITLSLLVAFTRLDASFQDSLTNGTKKSLIIIMAADS